MAILIFILMMLCAIIHSLVALLCENYALVVFPPHTAVYEKPYFFKYILYVI